MKIFKYRGGSFKRDLDALSNNYFWAPTREKLNDPCEGFFSNKDIYTQLDRINEIFVAGNNESTNAYLEVKKSLETTFEFVDKSGIYSLSKTPFEELLWAHYSVNHTGFCIEYNLGELIKYEKNSYTVLDVQYKGSPQCINFDDMGNNEFFIKKMLGTKSKAWEYESEVRIVTSASGKNEYDFQALKSIYFGLRMPDDEKTILMDTLKGRGIKYYQIVLENESYKFSYQQVDDTFCHAKKYKYSIAPIAEYAVSPDLVNEKYKPFIEYLHKAAEIVRREPDCNEVEYVDFSPSKGDTKNPVVFVQYKRKEQWVTHHLTINEIENIYSEISDLDVNHTKI